MQARMKHPAAVIPDARAAIRALTSAIGQGSVPSRTLDLVNLRTTQINGSSACADAAAKAKEDGETDQRLCALAGRCYPRWHRCAVPGREPAAGLCRAPSAGRRWLCA